MPLLRVPASRHGTRTLQIGAIVVATIVAARLVPGRTVWSADEADLAHLAAAMAETPLAWLRPDYHPSRHATLGHGLVAPPLASALMALPGLLGLARPEARPLLGLALYGLGLASLVATLRPGRWTALAATVVVVALSPRAILDAFTLEAEVPLTGFAMLAIAAALRRSSAAAGALLGLAFLAKLWLAGPPAVAVLSVLVAQRARPRSFAVFLATAIPVAGSHLALVAVLDPPSLARWLREVYFGGILGTKWAGVAGHPEWVHGAWYYPAAIARELGFAAPLAVVGAWRATRPARGAILGMAFGVAILSVPAVKEPLYVLPAIAVAQALAGAALVDLSARARHAWRSVAAIALAIGVAATVTRPTELRGDPRLPRIALAR